MDEGTQRLRTWAARQRGEASREEPAHTAGTAGKRTRFRRVLDVSRAAATLERRQLSPVSGNRNGTPRVLAAVAEAERTEAPPALGPHLARPLPPEPSRLSRIFDGPGWTAIQVGADVLAGVLAVVLALLTVTDANGIVASRPWILAFPVVLAAMLHLRGLYRPKVRVDILDGVGPIAGAVSVAAMGLLGPAIFLLDDVASAPVLGRVWGFALLLVIVVRAALVSLHRHVRARGAVGRPTLIVGAGLVGAQVARRLQEKPELGLRPVGFLDADPPASVHAFSDDPMLIGSPEDLADIAARTGARHVVFAFSNAPDHGLIPLARRCEELGLEVSIVPRFFESINDRIALERIGSLPLFGLRSVDPKGWQFGLKYALDRVLAAVLIVLLAPLMLAAALAVKVSSPGPVLFRQRRVGRDGQSFDLLKFRSMRVQETVDPFDLPPGVAPGGVEGVDRRTPIGRILRRTSIDELPQLFNVLKGEMSLVGPRPERPEFADRFGRDLERYHDRHRVKSGITGWAQVSGLRGQTSLHDRIEWDNVYIENWSLWFDVKILLLTLGAVVRTSHDA